MKQLNDKLVIESMSPRINNKYRDLYLSWRNSRLLHMPQYRNQLETDMTLLAIEDGNKILDVGCAFGFDLMEFANLGLDCHGTEITKEFAQIARTVSRYLRVKVNIVDGDACHLPYPDDSFDAVMSTEFFSHVADPAAALNEQVRVLKKGGKLLIRDGNILCPVILYDLLFAWTIRTRGKYGGLKWILTRQRTIHNYDDRGFDGKAENIKSLFWWNRLLRKRGDIKVEVATTGYAYRHPGIISNILKPFLGNILIAARKI